MPACPTYGEAIRQHKARRRERRKFGSTLSKDGFPRMEFDFMLANLPYGKSWKMDKAHIYSATERSD